MPLGIVGGDPLLLAARYVQLGITRVYVADLDSIQRGTLSLKTLTALLSSLPSGIEVLIDIGWRGDEDESAVSSIRSLNVAKAIVRWIAASESALSISAINSIASIVGPQHVLIGQDYRDGHWISTRFTQSKWLGAAEELSVAGTVILDLTTVGSGGGPTTIDACRELSHRFPTWRVLSGGGIRNARDVQAMLSAGCQACLVATAIHPFLQEKMPS